MKILTDLPEGYAIRRQNYLESIANTTTRRRRPRRTKVFCYELGETFENTTAAAKFIGVKSGRLVASLHQKCNCAVIKDGKRYRFAYKDGRLKNQKSAVVYCPQTQTAYRSPLLAAKFVGRSPTTIAKAVKTGKAIKGLEWRYLTPETLLDTIGLMSPRDFGMNIFRNRIYMSPESAMLHDEHDFVGTA